MKFNKDKNDDIHFKNKHYEICFYETDRKSLVYSIYYRGKRNKSYHRLGPHSSDYASGVIDESVETVTDYLWALSIFTKNKKYGKQAKRWLNKGIKPYFEKFGYNTSILYSFPSIGFLFRDNRSEYKQYISYEKIVLCFEKLKIKDTFERKHMTFEEWIEFRENLN